MEPQHLEPTHKPASAWCMTLLIKRTVKSGRGYANSLGLSIHQCLNGAAEITKKETTFSRYLLDALNLRYDRMLRRPNPIFKTNQL